jgi:hypothetical protein
MTSCVTIMQGRCVIRNTYFLRTSHLRVIIIIQFNSILYYLCAESTATIIIIIIIIIITIIGMGL